MESSETPPQPSPGDIKPIAAMQFEVVRRAEFVFEPFLGSLIQIPEARMQRAQSSEFFLAQSSTKGKTDEVEAPLVWERPRPVAQASTPAVPKTTEDRPAVPSYIRKVKPQKSPTEQEAPRFYEPTTVRFFDPVAAAAEDGQDVAGQFPEPRASTQLSPELKAAILRIDEQRRQMQQETKQDKSAKGKKRGVLKAKSANAADTTDAPIEIVKPRDVVITERAARWEEIAAPAPEPVKYEVQPPAAHIDFAPAMATSAPDEVDQVEAIANPIAPTLELPAMPATAPAQAYASSLDAGLKLEAVETQQVFAPTTSPHAARSHEISAIVPEVASAEEIVATPEIIQVQELPSETEVLSTKEAASTQNAIPIDTLPAAQPPESFAAADFIPAPEFSPTQEDLSEPKMVALQDVASTQDDIPVDSPVAPRMEAQPQETIADPGHEAFIEEEFVSSLEFALSDEDLYEATNSAIPDAALPPPPRPAMPSTSGAHVAEPAPIPLTPAALVKENRPSPLTFKTDASIITPEEDTPAEPPSTKRRRGIAAAISRLRRTDLVQEKVDTPILERPLEEESIDEAEIPRQKEKLPLATRLQRWLGGESPTLDGNRRRAERTIMPGLVAFYWSGGSPKPHEIVNISKTGFYVKTTEFWSVETLVRMTLQRPASETKRKADSISVLARVVRIDEEGVGHEFVTTEALLHARSMDVMPSHGTDTRALDKFLQVQ